MGSKRKPKSKSQPKANASILGLKSDLSSKVGLGTGGGVLSLSTPVFGLPKTLQEAVLVPETSSGVVWHGGCSTVRSDDTSGLFLFLPRPEFLTPIPQNSQVIW
jgi:hypothetical protein